MTVFTYLGTSRSRHYLALLGLTVLAVCTGLFLNNAYIRDIFLLAGIYVLYGTGWQLTAGLGGILSLAPAAFVAIGAYSSAYLTQKGLNSWLALVIGACICALCAVVIGLIILRLNDIYLAIATLAFAAIVTTVVSQWVSVTGGTNGLIAAKVDYSLFGLSIAQQGKHYFLLVWVLAIIGTFVAINYRSSGRGLVADGLRSSPIALAVSGIAPGYRKLELFVIGAVYASVGGSLYTGYIIALDPSAFTFDLVVLVITMVVVGGINSVWGPVVGAVGVICLQQFVVDKIAAANGGEQNVIFGLLLAFVLVVLPEGVCGAVAQAARRIPGVWLERSGRRRHGSTLSQAAPDDSVAPRRDSLVDGPRS